MGSQINLELVKNKERARVKDVCTDAEVTLTSSQQLSVQVGQSSRHRMCQTTAAHPVQRVQIQVATQRALQTDTVQLN